MHVFFSPHGTLYLSDVRHDQLGAHRFACARFAADDHALLLDIDQHVAEHVLGNGEDVWRVVHRRLFSRSRFSVLGPERNAYRSSIAVHGMFAAVVHVSVRIDGDEHRPDVRLERRTLREGGMMRVSGRLRRCSSHRNES